VHAPPAPYLSRPIGSSDRTAHRHCATAWYVTRTELFEHVRIESVKTISTSHINYEAPARFRVHRSLCIYRSRIRGIRCSRTFRYLVSRPNPGDSLVRYFANTTSESGKCTHTDICTYRVLSLSYTPSMNTRCTHTDICTYRVLSLSYTLSTNTRCTRTDICTYRVLNLSYTPNTNTRCSHTDICTYRVLSLSYTPSTNTRCSHTDTLNTTFLYTHTHTHCEIIIYYTHTHTHTQNRHIRTAWTTCKYIYAWIKRSLLTDKNRVSLLPNLEIPKSTSLYFRLPKIEPLHMIKYIWIRYKQLPARVP